MTALDGSSRKATIVNNATGTEEVVGFDMLHAVPPQRAPGWVAASPLANPASPFGYVEVDKHTLQHRRYPNVFALGDVADLPTSKTGAAVRKQAPVLVANLVAEMRGVGKRKSYDGYSSCPFVTARDRMMLAEFDYELNPSPSIPVIDTTKDRRDMWLLKRYGLPAMYWHGMVKGRV